MWKFLFSLCVTLYILKCLIFYVKNKIEGVKHQPCPSWLRLACSWFLCFGKESGGQPYISIATAAAHMCLCLCSTVCVVIQMRPAVSSTNSTVRLFLWPNLECSTSLLSNINFVLSSLISTSIKVFLHEDLIRADIRVPHVKLHVINML